jgi:hypothetical protein
MRFPKYHTRIRIVKNRTIKETFNKNLHQKNPTNPTSDDETHERERGCKHFGFLL